MAGEMNAKILAEMNGLIGDMNKKFETGAGLLRSELDLITQMVDVLGKMDAKGATDTTKEMGEALDAVAGKLKDVGGGSSAAMTEVIEGMDRAEKKTGALSKAFDEFSSEFPTFQGIAVGALDGFVDGLEFMMNSIKGAIDLMSSLAQGAFSVGKAILAIPFRILDSLIQKASSGGGGTELAEAFEHVRKVFGSFKEDVAKNVIASARSMNGELANTGLSVWRVMGNLAERLNYVRDIAEKMGPTFHQLGAEFAQNSEVLVAYQKGLGVSAESMKGLGELAIRSGQPLAEVGRQMANYSLQVASGFGLSQKVVARDVSLMINDIKNFGSLNVKQMTTSSIYVRKLGLDFKEVLGVVDKFDTFKDAAESAAGLAQAFGANVDALKLMQEQDPAKRVDMLRQSLFAAGKSAENMTRQELKLLTQTTGLSEAAAKQAFSLKNQGVSYDAIAAKSDEAEKSQLTQAEAMSKLADSIERLVKGGGGGFTSFLDAFLKGFERGVQTSKEFIQIMMNLRQSLMVVFQAGFQVGQAFEKIFPGVRDTFQGIADLFNPAKFRVLGKGVVAAFTEFFTDLEQDVDPTRAVGDLLNGLTGAFGSAFGSSGGILSKIAGSMLKFGKTLASIVEGLMPIVAEGISTLIIKITDFLTSEPDKHGMFAGLKNSVINGLGKIADAFVEVIPKFALGFANMIGKITQLISKPKIDAGSDSPKEGIIGKVLEPILGALGKAWEVIYPKFEELFDVLKNKLIDWAKGPTGKKFLFGAFVYLTGPVALSTVFGAIKGMGGMIGKAIIDSVFGPTSEGIISKGVSKLAPQFLTKLMGPLSGALKVAGPIGLLVGAAVGISNGLEKFGALVTEGADKADNKIGAAGAGLIDTLTFGLLPDFALTALGNEIAKGATKIGELITSVFGPQFTENIKSMISSRIDLFAALGDVIKSLFTGDASKITAAIGTFIPMLASELVKGFAFVLVDVLPKIITFAAGWSVKLVGGLYGLIGQAFNAGKNIPIIGGFLEFIGGLFTNLGSIISTIGDKIINLGQYFDTAFKYISKSIDWAKENFGTFFKIIAVGAAALTAPLWGPFFVAFKVIKGGIDLMGDRFAGIFNKIKIAAAIITAPLWIPFYLAYKLVSAVWDKAKTFFSDIFASIIAAVKPIITEISSKFFSAWENIKAIFSKASSWFSENVIDPIVDGFNSVKDKVKDSFESTLNTMIEVFKPTIFGELFGNILTALKEKLDKFMKVGGSVFGDIIQVAKKVFDIHSPSRVFSKIGDQLAEGFQQGIETMPTDMKKTAESSIDAFSKTMQDGSKNSAQTLSLPQIKAPDSSNFTQYFDLISGSMKKLKDGASSATSSTITPAISAVQDMVSAVNDLHTDIASGISTQIKLKPQLEALVNSAGMVGNDSFTIKKKDFQINVYVEATMHAGKVEQVLTSRVGSKIATT